MATSRDPFIPVWPVALAPTFLNPMMDAPVFKGPRPALGAPQYVMSDAGIWRLSMIDMPVHGWRLRAIRALIARMVVESTPLYVPLWQSRSAIVPAPEGAAHGDDAVFDDGSLYEGVAPYGTIAVAAVKAATAFVFTPPSGVTISAGSVVTIGERAYMISRITGNGANKTAYIWPKLREALVVGDRVELHNPMVKMRIDPASISNALGPYDAAQHGRVTIEFVEDSWR